MSLKEIIPGLYQILLGPVNAFLIDDDGLTLVDTGIPGSTKKILKAIETLGKKASDIQHILVTHCHPDHTGSLAELKGVTDAPAYMHPTDAAMVRAGKAFRPLTPTPELITGIMFRLFRISSTSTTITATQIEHEVQDGDELAIAGGLRALHVPGHCAGQLAFHWPRHGGVMFAADTAMNTFGLGYILGYEDLEEGKRSLAKIAGLDFEVACFGHGDAIRQGASRQFKQKWTSQAVE